METKTRYVWLNVRTGEFSNSWTEEEMRIAGGINELLDEAHHKPEWKLIKYSCLSDEDFEFYRRMTIR